MEVKTHGYEDDGLVDAETIITLDDTELVVVDYSHTNKHRVFERDVGDTEPHSRLDNNE